MKNPVIRSIYLYLFALIGLGMLVVGASMIVNLGLKAWVFTKADQNQDYYMERPTSIIFDKELETVKDIEACSDKCEFTESEKEQISAWLDDYQDWKNQSENRDPNFYTERTRQRQAATAISLILIGLPVWLFHWSVIKRDVREDKEGDKKEA